MFIRTGLSSKTFALSIFQSILPRKEQSCMQAIGVGDCDLHCVDNMGNPCVLTIKDVLCIPDANKSLISVSMLHREGYHCIYPTTHPVCPPGLYQPPRKVQSSQPKSGGVSRKHRKFLLFASMIFILSAHVTICLMIMRVHSPDLINISSGLASSVTASVLWKCCIRL